MTTRILQNMDFSDIEKQTGALSGIIKPIPAADVTRYGADKVRLFLHKYALYTMPTTELIDHLAGIIAGRTAIEIGAGMGVIGRSLKIPLTDNKMQEWPEVKAQYQMMGQPTIQYPCDVEKLDALAAVKKYRPQVVIGSYITHLWKPGMSHGNQYGVDTLKLIKSVDEYYMIGNLQTHVHDPAMKFLYDVERHDFLHTRGRKDTSVIFHWKK